MKKIKFPKGSKVIAIGYMQDDFKNGFVTIVVKTKNKLIIHKI